ncbi:hypothetical protein [Glycomyces salinus]|uniref:hypothetical protein n=1 Tax=Glycomyces salinus TaxID=980294 RepID=UPI0018ED9540|nr:hypothetical protein [Glycomyces salinus]
MSPIGNASAQAHAGRRRAPLLALAAAGALAVSACGDVPSGTLNTSAGYSFDNTEATESVCPDGDDYRLPAEEGTLIGPHFALQVDCVATFEEFPDGYQTRLLFGDDEALYPPPAGYEFALIQFAPEPEVEAPLQVDGDTELTATLSVGEREWSFDGEAPAPGAAYFTVVEKDAPISLTVDDSERVQSIDLRERTREGLIEALYHGSRQTITTDWVENEVSASKSEGGYEYSLDRWGYSTSFVVDRSVYNETEGWLAENDRARLTIEFVWWRESAELDLIWDIDAEEVLKVEGPDGELAPSSVDHTDEEWEGGDIGRYFTLVYDVPADALEFDLSFHPDGVIEWTEHGVDMNISGDENHDISVDFT